MNRLIATLVTIAAVFATSCAIREIKNVQLPQNLVGVDKEKIRREWGVPYKTSTAKDKLHYDADELWVYRYPDTSSPCVDYYLYFQNGHLIKWDNVIWNNL